MVGGVLCIVQTPTFHNLAGLQYLIKGAPLGMTWLPLPPQITLLRYGRGRKIATVYTICTCGIYSSTGCNLVNGHIYKVPEYVSGFTSLCSTGVWWIFSKTRSETVKTCKLGTNPPDDHTTCHDIRPRVMISRLVAVK